MIAENMVPHRMGCAEACATFDIRWVGVDVLRLKGCVPGANLFGGDNCLTHRSPLNTKGDDAADPEESDVRGRESGFRNKRRPRIQMRSPLLFGVRTEGGDIGS